MIDLVEVSTAAVSLITPFLPILRKSADNIGESFQETILKRGGDAIWNSSKKIWLSLCNNLQGDRKKRLEELADELISFENRPRYKEIAQEEFAAFLAQRLKEDSNFLQELQALIGNDSATQEIIARNNSLVERVKQTMHGGGKQKIMAGDDSIISDADQQMTL